MYITEPVWARFLCVCFGKVKSDARPDQLIAFTRCRNETLPIKYGDLPSAALNQTGMFHVSDGIGDGWPLHTQHFGEQALSDLQCVIVSTVTHHKQPTRQPLLETVRPVARYRHQDLLEKSLCVSVHQSSERRHRPHGPCERRARHPCCVPRDLNEKPDGGTLGAKDGLHGTATLPTDRCHFNDTAVRIDRHHRDDTAVGEEYIVERTISIHQDLPAFAAYLLKLRHKLLEIGGWQGE